MVPKGLNAFGSFVIAQKEFFSDAASACRAPVSFLSFLGPEGPKMGAPNRALGEFFSIWELCACSRERQFFPLFLGPEGRPQNGGFFHLIDKIADFLHNKLFFLIAPRDLHYYWASAQPCADRLRR